MSLLGTFDVVELTDTRLVLSKEDKVELGGLSYQQKTVYSYHKLVTGGK